MEQKNNKVSKNVKNIGIKLMSIDMFNSMENLCFMKFTSNGNTTYCMVKNTFYDDNGDAAFEEMCITNGGVDLSDKQKMIITTIASVVEHLEDVTFGHVNRINEFCFDVYMSCHESCEFKWITEFICENIGCKPTHRSIDNAIKGLKRKNKDQLIEMIIADVAKKKSECDKINQELEAKKNYWLRILEDTPNLSREQCDVLIPNRNDIVDFFGEDIFYKFASRFNTKQVTTTVSVENGSDEYDKYIRLCYPVIAETRNISCIEGPNNGEYVPFSTFRLPFIRYGDPKLMNACIRELIPELASKSTFYVDATDYKDKDGEYLVFFRGENRYDTVLVPLRALVNNDFEEIAKYHTDYLTKRHTQYPTEIQKTEGTLEQNLAALKLPSTIKLKKLLDKRAKAASTHSLNMDKNKKEG